jgi:hypothetical protein
MTKTAFDWRSGKSTLAPEFAAPVAKKISPQLAYYYRSKGAGIHPTQLRRAGLPVVDRRYKANRGSA